MYLHKSIPSGAGLGGGSADGAFTLKMLNQLGGLNLSQQQLINYAAILGSDCPFFISNKPCYATGRGEVLEEIQLDISSYSIVLINPGIHVETAKAFSDITPAHPAHSLKELIQQPVSEWKNVLYNDFEKTVFNSYPAIGEIKEALYRQGALYAAMSGSGSTVYGIFNKKELPVLSFPEAYFVRVCDDL
jgi:4-diphosphocytidyl-2-C-methyl-D-erythritol kinase